MATNRVEGDNGDNRIDATFAADPEGEAIDAGNGPGGTNNDVVDGFGGSDTILSGEGDDTVFAGSGSDSVEGGSGDDLLVGDSDGAGSGEGRSVFQWDLAPDLNDANPIEPGDPIMFFTQDTGSVDVTFSVLSATGPVETEFADNTQDVSGVETGGGTRRCQQFARSRLGECRHHGSQASILGRRDKCLVSDQRSGRYRERAALCV